MNLTTLLDILSAISKLPTAAIIVGFLVCGGIAIGLAIAFRDIPKYCSQTIIAFLNFILSILGKEQIYAQTENKADEMNEDVKKTLKLIQGGKNKKDDKPDGTNQMK